ncbi:cytochrome P450 [Desarmillaria ectypa]|nr:cytochrome P450 [Desarmillaria ectypa]
MQQDILSVADPKPPQYIFHSSGYRFSKTRDTYRIQEAPTGQDVVTIRGIRRNPPTPAEDPRRCFCGASAPALPNREDQRAFEDGRVLDVFEWTNKAAILPEWLLLLLAWLPSRETTRMNRFRDVAMEDVVNVLAMSYLNDDAKKMCDTEVDSQLATFVIAGHDTRANTMVWLLYELRLHPEDQAKIREEIAQTKSNASGTLTSNDYDSMLWLNVCIKEALRPHPLVYGLFREPAQDVLPLAEPITISDDKLCPWVPISKGWVVMASELPSVWDDDAEEWNPCRFLDGRESKQTSLGVHANLYGLCWYLCMPWVAICLSADQLMSVMELQSVVTELVDNFELIMSKGTSKLQHGPAGVALSSIVPGKADEGPQIPLLVTALTKSQILVLLCLSAPMIEEEHNSVVLARSTDWTFLIYPQRPVLLSNRNINESTNGLSAHICGPTRVSQILNNGTKDGIRTLPESLYLAFPNLHHPDFGPRACGPVLLNISAWSAASAQIIRNLERSD